MNHYCCMHTQDQGGEPFVVNVPCITIKNSNYRTAVWTGDHLQMTVMSIPPRGEIGMEIHPDTDQLIRVEQGMAEAVMGKCGNCPDSRQMLRQGDAVLVPAGTWHNVMNRGRNSLKVSVVYGPPNHAKGTVHRTKEEADREEYSGSGM